MSRDLKQEFFQEFNQLIADLSLESSAFFVALSGGADSSALLSLLVDYQRQYKLSSPIYALHFNHQLQEGAASWRDFCQSKAEQVGFEFVYIDATISVDKKQGLESSARKARYDWFAETMREHVAKHGYQQAILLTGHHADDQAETILMNILRGTGINGLRGIARSLTVPVSKQFSYHIMRPLLSFDKSQLIDYLQQKKLSWIEDMSNQDTAYRRNAIRHNVMPELKKIKADVVKQFGRLSQKSVDIESILFDMASIDLNLISKYFGFCPLDESYGLGLENLRSLSIPRQLNALRYWLDSIGYPADSEIDLLTILDWSINGTTASTELKRGKRCYRYYRDVLYVMPIERETVVMIKNMQWTKDQQQLNVSEYFLGEEHVVVAADEPLSTDLQIFSRQEAAKLRLRDKTGHINPKNCLQDCGVPPWRRDHAIFIADSNGVYVTVVGGQKSNGFNLYVNDANSNTK